MDSQTILSEVGGSDAPKDQKFNIRAIVTTATLVFTFAFLAGYAVAPVVRASPQPRAGPSQEVVQLYDSNQSKVKFARVRNLATTIQGKPYFKQSWIGNRHDFDGEVGIQFTAKKLFFITALGRECGVGGCKESTKVTLWSSDKRALASVSLRDGSTAGTYVFSKLAKPILMEAGNKFRISMQCHRGMTKWADHQIASWQLPLATETEYASFEGSCYQTGYGYPDRLDGDKRRPGMVNFIIEEAVPASQCR